jgi:sugar lactone lactonase YvrE
MRTIVVGLAVVAMMTLWGCESCNDEAATGATSCIDDRTCPDAGDAGSDADADDEFTATCQGSDCAECLIGPEGGFCEIGACTLTARPGALPFELPIFLADRLAADGVSTDLIDGGVCEVRGLEVESNLPLQVERRFETAAIPEGFAASELLGVDLTSGFELANDAVLQASSMTFAISNDRTVGISARPSHPRFEREFGRDAFEIVDDATYLRNISRYSFGAAFHDGTRFYAANGPRVLIWVNGVPTDPYQLPDIVLGRPDLETDTPFVSASSFGVSVRSIWSDGNRLAISEGNRVLIWNEVPTRNFAPADIVLGQDDFSTNLIDKGGEVGRDTLDRPDQIWSDGERFFVADTQNHRYLAWETFPVVSGQEPDFVIGQEDFDSSGIGAGALSTYQARGVYGADGRIALSASFSVNGLSVLESLSTNNVGADFTVGATTGATQVQPNFHERADAISGYGARGLSLANNWRISLWSDFPEMGRDEADITLGKPNASVGGLYGPLTASSIHAQTPVLSVFGNEQLVAAGAGPRLLVWRSLPQFTFEPADLILGQPAAGTSIEAIDVRGISRGTFSLPSAMSAAADGTIAIADRGNNRVLVGRPDDLDSGSMTVLGHVDGRRFQSSQPTPTSLNDPAGVWTDGSRVVVADSGNHRVLIWNQLPVSDGQPADQVLGQPTFNSSDPNWGAGDSNSDGLRDASPTSLFYPSGVFVDSFDRLWVADANNHRVVGWSTFPVGNNEPPDLVLGQPDLSSNAPNSGLGFDQRTAATLARPVAVAEAFGYILIADSENSRILGFDAVTLGSNANTVIGQPDFASNVSPERAIRITPGLPVNPSSKTASAQTLRTPTDLAVDSNGALWVADTGNNRIIRFDEVSTNAAAAVVIGQSGLDSREANFNGVSASSVAAPAGVAAFNDTLLISDTKNHRVLSFDRSDTTIAAKVFGQTLSTRNGINGSAPAFNALDRPSGMASHGERIWVADSDFNRVVTFDREGNQQGVIGQADGGGDLPNAGLEVATRWSMRKPSDVWTNGTMLVVADTGNHRVLVWNSIPVAPNTPADVILGQPNGESIDPNRGNGAANASAASLQSPRGVFVDNEGALWVADSGNARVLKWSTLPVEDGTPANEVVCQPNFNENRANRGTSQPTEATCASPSDILVLDSKLLVADTLNHRVLTFDRDGENGRAAESVFGQPDFQSRSPLNGAFEVDGATLNNPTRMDTDGVNFFVVDRGNHRVLVWRELPSVPTTADLVLGQVGFVTAIVTPNIEGLAAPDGLAVEAQPFFSTTIWVADGAKDRIAVYARVPRPLP